jgi:hypothetical protein
MAAFVRHAADLSRWLVSESHGQCETTESEMIEGASLTPSGKSIFFGSSVATSDSVCVVGARLSVDQATCGTGSGLIHVFDLIDGELTQPMCWHRLRAMVGVVWVQGLRSPVM